jgi:hypothetical protein
VGPAKRKPAKSASTTRVRLPVGAAEDRERQHSCTDCKQLTFHRPAHKLIEVGPLVRMFQNKLARAVIHLCRNSARRSRLPHQPTSPTPSRFDDLGERDAHPTRDDGIVTRLQHQPTQPFNAAHGTHRRNVSAIGIATRATERGEAERNPPAPGLHCVVLKHAPRHADHLQEGPQVAVLSDLASLL